MANRYQPNLVLSGKWSSKTSRPAGLFYLVNGCQEILEKFEHLLLCRVH